MKLLYIVCMMLLILPIVSAVTYNETHGVALISGTNTAGRYGTEFKPLLSGNLTSAGYYAGDCDVAQLLNGSKTQVANASLISGADDYATAWNNYYLNKVDTYYLTCSKVGTHPVHYNDAFGYPYVGTAINITGAIISSNAVVDIQVNSFKWMVLNVAAASGNNNSVVTTSPINYSIVNTRDVKFDFTYQFNDTITQGVSDHWCNLTVYNYTGQSVVTSNYASTAFLSGEHALPVANGTASLNISFNNLGEFFWGMQCNDTNGNKFAAKNKTLFVVPTAVASQSSSTDSVGDTTTFSLILNISDLSTQYQNSSAYFNINGSIYQANKYLSDDGINFSYSKNWPAGYGAVAGRAYSWNWNYSIVNDSGIAYKSNTSTLTHTVYDIVVDGCETYTDTIMNFSVYDETTRSSASLANQSVQVAVNLTKGNISYSYNQTGTDYIDICIPSGLLVGSTYYLTSTTRYTADDHAVEYKYIKNYLLTDNTRKNYSLYTLNTDQTLPEYSTSFIVQYRNENYLPVAGVIIELQRYYVGSDQYIAVEDGLTDNEGKATLHIVAEDVQYRIAVRQNNAIIYQSTAFIAVCQAVPCSLTFDAVGTLNNIDEFTEYDNLNYDLTLDKDTRTVTATYSTLDGSAATLGLRILKSDAYLNTTVCDNTLTSSGGSISCVVPVTSLNMSYYTELYNTLPTEEKIAVRSFNLNPSAIAVFGTTGIIMTLFLFITLAAMAISSGMIAVIIFGVVGLALATLLNIFEGGNVFGVGSTVIWLIITAVIIIWKINKGANP